MKIETIAIYVRVSTQEQAKEGYSIDEQLDRLRKYCEAHDWKLTKEYADPGYSGAKLERPAITQLIRDVQEGKISRVFVYKLDRLSRSQKDTLYLIEDIFLSNDTDFISMTENFDTSTPFGKAMIGILSVFAQLEREQIKERMSMGKVGRAKEGRWIGTHKPPIGYRYIDGELVVDPYEAEIVRIIFQRYVDGEGVMAISNYLKEKGMKSSYGELTKATIYFILHNTVYIGMVKYSGVDYPGKHEAIIDQVLFNKVQERFEKNKNNPRFANNMNNFSACSRYTGLFRCTCGCHMRVTYGNKRKDGTRLKYYSCCSKSEKHMPCVTNNKMVKGEIIEKKVSEEIQKLKLNPNAIIQAIGETRQLDNTKEVDNQILLIRNKICDIDKQIEKLIKLYSIQNIDFEIVTKQIQSLTDEKNLLNETVKDLKSKIDDNSELLSYDEIIQAVDKLNLEDLNLGPFDKSSNDREFNEILRILIDRIVITCDTINIHWNF